MAVLPAASGAKVLLTEEAPVVSLGAYASGDLIGGKLTMLAVADLERGGGIIQTVVLTDRAKQSVNVDVVFFGSNPGDTMFTDNAALAIADVDLVKVLGFAQVNNYSDFSDNSVGQALNVAIPFCLAMDGVLYAAIVARGAPTYVATDDLMLRVMVLRV